jgi:diketogulonate reductase-like aldo/keto reductase
VGYRSIDTAQAYRNEEAVGGAISKSGAQEPTCSSRPSLDLECRPRKGRCIHRRVFGQAPDGLPRPAPHPSAVRRDYGTYRAMEDAYRAGKVRAIGVSNFYPDRLIDLVQFNEIVPAVIQVETHPFQQQAAAHEIMKKYGVQHESWGPFAEGRQDMFANATIRNIGDKYAKSVAQVILRFLIQRDVVVIPRRPTKSA